MGFLDFIDPGNSGGSVPAPSSPWDGLPPPAPVKYRCSVCNAAFSDADELFDHRFSEHPYTRPTLILNGRELTAPRELLLQPLSERQITLTNADHCAFDGKIISPTTLPHLLSQQRGGAHTIILEKLGIETRYEILFEIAVAKELDDVDRLFLSSVGSDTLTVDRINVFVELTTKYKTALPYVDGLCHYLYGVLAKDQRGGTRLVQGEYKTKFNLALDRLRHFARPLASVVVGVVNFSENAFNDGDTLLASPRLQYAMRVYYGFTSQVVPASANSWSGVGMGNVPVDHATDQVVQWAIESKEDFLLHRREMEMAIDSADWVPDDRFKVSMLLAARLSSFGDVAAAKRFARSVTNDALFGDWAQRIMDLDNEK
jgi:hypothetical protein